MIFSTIRAGGFANEVYHSLPSNYKTNLMFFVEDEWYTDSDLLQKYKDFAVYIKK